jgi:undecaprenyl-diphosphatase
MELWQAVLIAIVEGLTEFLPVSSTGHMVLVAAAMGIHEDAWVKLFEIAIQLGAILSVVVLYRKRFLTSNPFPFYRNLFLAFLPAAFFGVLFKSVIDEFLESTFIIGCTLLLGGFVLIYVDKWFLKTADQPSKSITPLKAFLIGCFQVLAMVPGVSRSAATIIGGLSQGFGRKQAAEFSFFLAVPTMFGATAKSTWDLWSENPELFNTGNVGLLLMGNVLAFLVAALAIRSFIKYLTKHGFYWFGWYRIALGALVIYLSIG